MYRLCALEKLKNFSFVFLDIIIGQRLNKFCYLGRRLAIAYSHNTRTQYYVY